MNKIKLIKKSIMYFLIIVLLLNYSLGAITTDDIVDTWEFQNNYNSASGGNDLIPYGTPTFSTTIKKFGTHSINLSDTGLNYLVSTINSSTYTNNHAIEMWIYSEGFTSGYSFLVSANSSTTDYSYYLTSSPFHLYKDASAVSLEDYNQNVWTHFIFTWDGLKGNVYFNGSLIYDSWNDTPVAGTDLFFGHHSDDSLNRGFNGHFNIIRIWNKNLTQSDVTYLYDSSNGKTYLQLKQPNASIIFTSITPLNGTNINNSINMNFTLQSINISANCTILNNGIQQETQYNLVNSTYNFNFNSSYWSEGNNNISIVCNDSTYTFNTSKILFVDTVLPKINYINNTIAGNSSEINNTIISTVTLLNLSVQAEDNNLYLLNITIYNNITKEVVFSNQTTSITQSNYTGNYTYNIENKTRGTYIINVTASDAHTKNKIDFEKELKVKNVNDDIYLGKIFDDKIKTYSEKDKIESFDIIQNVDRYNFKLKFKNNIESFKIYVEANNLDYLNNKYGFKGHFILNNYYWLDFENNYDINIQNVEKINDHKYIITLFKDKDLNEIVFDSIGIINTNNVISKFSYFYTTVNIILKDSVTLNLINYTNITVQYIGENLQIQSKTDTGLSSFNTSFEGLTDNAVIRAFSSDINDYSIISRSVILDQSQTETNYTFYLTNTSDSSLNKEITFLVLDENKKRLESAIVKVYKQNPSTNELLLLTDLYTNPNGEAITKLTLDTIFYSFIVEYNGDQVFISNKPISISDSTTLPITLNVVIGDSFTQNYINYFGLDGTLNFVRVNNESGYYTLNYKYIYDGEICLHTYTVINTVSTNNSYQCSTDKSGIITSPTASSTQLALFYGDVYIDYDSDELSIEQVDTKVNYIGYDYDGKSNPDRLIVMIMLVILSGTTFIFSPVIGLITLAIGTLIVVATKFTILTLTLGMFIVGLCVFAIITYIKRNR
jgi:hypothetical protein